MYVTNFFENGVYRMSSANEMYLMTAVSQHGAVSEEWVDLEKEFQEPQRGEYVAELNIATWSCDPGMGKFARGV